MDDRQLPEDEKHDEESLANRPLVPVDGHGVGANVARGVILLGVGAGAFVLVANMLTPTHGATRSSKLKWEQRQLEIEQAQRDAESTTNRQE